MNRTNGIDVKSSLEKYSSLFEEILNEFDKKPKNNLAITQLYSDLKNSLREELKFIKKNIVNNEKNSDVFAIYLPALEESLHKLKPRTDSKPNKAMFDSIVDSSFYIDYYLGMF